MKLKLLYCCALTGLLLPALRAQDSATNSTPAGPISREQLREELSSLPPEQREARIRELRAQFEQQQPGPRPMPGQQGGVPGFQAVRLGNGLERINQVLTPEQRNSLRQRTEEKREDFRTLDAPLRDARKAVLFAAADKVFNEEIMRQKLATVARLETEITLLQAGALARIEPPLSDAQIEQIKNPAPMPQFAPNRNQMGTNGMPLKKTMGKPLPQGVNPALSNQETTPTPSPAQP